MSKSILLCIFLFLAAQIQGVEVHESWVSKLKGNRRSTWNTAYWKWIDDHIFTFLIIKEVGFQLWETSNHSASADWISFVSTRRKSWVWFVGFFVLFLSVVLGLLFFFLIFHLGGGICNSPFIYITILHTKRHLSKNRLELFHQSLNTKLLTLFAVTYNNLPLKGKREHYQKDV